MTTATLERQRTQAAEDSAPVATPQEKFANFRQVLNDGLIERTAEIDIMLTAALVREHPLFVAVPGTAKSMMCDAFTQWIDGNAFSILLNRFTTPEEVYGPVSVKGLKTDDYRRITTGFLSEANVAFLDECFKASSAILNTMLKVLNEREYRNGNAIERCPLEIAVAASNEWPQEQNELGALFDRFLFRRKVETIRSTKGMERLLWEPNLGPKVVERITLPELAQARAEAAALQYTPDAREAFAEILTTVRGEGIFPGDRRLRKSVGACKAYAYLVGAIAVDKIHLDILAHTLWEDPSEQPRKVAEIVGKIANPAGMKVMELMAQIDAAVRDVSVTDIGQVTTCHQKLKDIRKQLETIKGGNGNVTHAMAHCDEEMSRIKKAVVAYM